MAYVWEVTEALSLLTDIDHTEKETAESICRRCLDEILTMVRPDVEQSDPRIISAAAGKAFYHLCIKRLRAQEEETMTNFKAGDLSVSYESAKEHNQLNCAKEVCSKAMTELTPLLTDNGFFFGKVDIYD